MKKSKVDKLIRKFRAEGVSEGEARGRQTERRHWEALLPQPGRDGVTWLEPDAHRHGKLAQLMVVEPMATYGFDEHMRSPYIEHHVLRFEAVPMALNLANGQQIRWFHWKPIGPYPAQALAVVR